jgi:hypothetical protein
MLAQGVGDALEPLSVCDVGLGDPAAAAAARSPGSAFAPVLREGFLLKKKQKGLRLGVFNWQHRYCIVDGESRSVKYGPKESLSEWRGISFDDIQRCYMSAFEEGDSAAPGATGVANGAGSGAGVGGALGGVAGVEFEVQLTHAAANNNGDRVFTFRAPDPLSARKWVQTIHGVSIQGRGERRVSQVIREKLDIIQYEKNHEYEAKEDDAGFTSSPRAASRGMARSPSSTSAPTAAASKGSRGNPKIYTAALDTVVLSKLERYHSERSLSRMSAAAEPSAPGAEGSAGTQVAGGIRWSSSSPSSTSSAVAGGSEDGFEVVQKSAVEAMQLEKDAEVRAVAKQKSLTERILARAREREQRLRGRSSAGEPETASPVEATTPQQPEKPAQGARWRTSSHSLRKLAPHSCLPCLAFVCLKKGPQPEMGDD